MAVLYFETTSPRKQKRLETASLGLFERKKQLALHSCLPLKNPYKFFPDLYPVFNQSHRLYTNYDRKTDISLAWTRVMIDWFNLHP
jgi:hypothetical protein